MDWSLSSLAAATVVFAATDIDDILILAAFFGDRTLRRRAVVLGQFAGIAIITAVSAIAAYLALTIPEGWIALLGLVPLGMGLRKLWQLRSGVDADDDDELEAARRAESVAERRLHSQLAAVAAVTVANGGDNFSVYIPVFANDIAGIPAYATVFMLLTGAWCAVAYLLVNNPAGATVMRRWGHVLLPVVLVAIGAWILWDAREALATLLTRPAA